MTALPPGMARTLMFPRLWRKEERVSPFLSQKQEETFALGWKTARLDDWYK